MNPDYYSQIKLCERFIFESSLYLLTMFDKKIDSFVSSRNRNSRERSRRDLRNHNCVIDPDSFLVDPAKEFAKDLTKPMWNCKTTAQPIVLLVDDRQKIQSPIITLINTTIRSFLERYKNEHEDESSLRIHLRYVNKEEKVQEMNRKIRSRVMEEQQQENPLRPPWLLFQELFSYLIKLKNKQAQYIDSKRQHMDFQENYGMAVINLQAVHQILERVQERHPEGHLMHSQLVAETFSFAMLIKDNIKGITQVGFGPVLISYCPEIELIPELIHPILLGIYLVIKGQSPIEPVNTAENRSLEDTIFDELRCSNCSKIVFLNLDGYEAPMNIPLAKYLGKYLQYISFPLEAEQLLRDKDLSQYFQAHSQELARQYVYNELNEDQKELQMTIYKLKEKNDKELVQYYKRLLIFPIHSLALRSKHNLNSIEGFQSNFILFSMRELIFTQIKEFNPSIVVISYSGKLGISNPHFLQIIRELTVLANMKLLFYCNLTKSYQYEKPVPQQMLQTDLFYEKHQLHNQRYNQSINIWKNNRLNYDFLDKISIFLKISSATHSLEKTLDQDNVLEKYCNFKILKYAGSLIKIISKNHPILEKLKSRCNEYLKVDKILNNYYAHEGTPQNRSFNKLSLYTNKLICAVQQALESPPTNCLQAYELIVAERGYVTAESEIWKGFLFHYKLKIKQEREREELKFFARIPEWHGSQEQSQNLIGVEFQIQFKGVQVPVSLSSNSQVCYSPQRKGPKTIFLVMNHLTHQSCDTLGNFWGSIKTENEYQYEYKIQLQPLTLNQKMYLLNPFEYFCQFNYYETPNYLILFWPVIYNEQIALMYDLANEAYKPTPTSLIFIANRSNPSDFRHVLPDNKESLDIIPRTGCTCYSPKNSQFIYIFGGFYQQQKNYLSFQNDISCMMISNQGNIVIQNMPKSFHFNYERVNDVNRITKFNNDFVRPRIEYQVFQLEDIPQKQMQQIILLGGVGEKFMRPFSMLGYMGHVISFNNEGRLIEIRRVKLNNLVPVNLLKGVKSRANMEGKMIEGIQNRQIYTKKSLFPVGAHTYSWVNLQYNKDEEKVTYKKEYDYGIWDEERFEAGQTTVQIRENGQTISAKMNLKHYHGREENQNILLLSSQNHQGTKYVLNIGLQLRPQVYQKYINLQSENVPLTGHNIVAIDTIGLEVYALILHNEYTQNKYILAHLDLTSSVQQAINNQDFDIYLREIYRFDCNYSHHFLKALPGKRIILVHGMPLLPHITYPEVLLKRLPKGSVRSQAIQNTTAYAQKIENISNISIYKGNYISFIIDHGEAILCLTMRSVSRQLGKEELALFIDELVEGSEGVGMKWVLKREGILKLQVFSYQQDLEDGIFHILDLRCSQQERRWQIYASFKETVFVGVLNLNANEDSVQMQSTELSIEEYEKNQFYKAGKYALRIHKYKYQYEENQSVMEEEMNS